MGKAISKLGRRSVRNWNAENRAQREINRQTKRTIPKVSPKHPGSILETSEEFAEMDAQKSAKLDDMLKKVRLDSYGPPPEIRSAQKNLPENRGLVQSPEFGYEEPSVIPPGKCSIRQALEFITNHQLNPENYTTKKIADEYKLDEAKVQQIVKYFLMLNLELPKGSAGAQLLEQERTAIPMQKTLPKNMKDNSNQDPSKVS